MIKSPKFSTWCGSLRIEQNDNDRTTTLDVRRVKTDAGEHVQIAVEAAKHHAKRTVSQYGSLTLRPEDVPYLITALTKLHPPRDPATGYKPYSSQTAAEREFYGLPPEVKR